MNSSWSQVRRVEGPHIAALPIVMALLLVSVPPLPNVSHSVPLTPGFPILMPSVSRHVPGRFALDPPQPLLPTQFPSLSLGDFGSAPWTPTTPLASCLGSVQDTLVASNNTTLPGNFQGFQVYDPIDVVYAQAGNELLVLGYYSHNVGFFNATTGQEAVIVAPDEPWYSTGMVYDPANGLAYVSDLDPANNGGNVSVVDVGTRTLLAEIPVGQFPRAAAFDPANNEVYVPNEVSGDVSVISTTSNSVVGTLGAGSYTMSVAYDSHNGYLYVANQGGNITVINPAMGKSVASISLSSLGYPMYDMYDASDNDLYVGIDSPSSNPYTPGTVAVINATSYATVARIGVGDTPIQITLDPLTGQAFVSNALSNTTTVITTSTNTVAATLNTGTEPVGSAFVGTSGHVYIADAVTNNLTVLVGGAPPMVVGSLPVTTLLYGTAFDGGTGDAYATSFDLARKVAGTLYKVNGASLGIAGRAPVGMGSVAAAYDPLNKDIYVSNVYSDNVSVMNGSTMKRVATVSVGLAPGGEAVDTSNGYVYVAESGSNAVTVINGVTNTVVTTIATGPGTNSSWITFDPANGHLFVSNSNATSLTVINGATDTVITTFTPLAGYHPEGLTYDPVNGEVYVSLQNVSGGPGRQDLTVAINATTYATVARMAVGVNPIGLQYDPVDGDIYVANSNSDNVSIIDGATDRVIGSLTVGNVPVQVSVDLATGELYVTNIWSGSLSFITPAAKGCATFAANIYETGLPAGTSWTVSLNGTYLSGNGTTLSALEPNGTYSFSVGAVAGYSVSPSSGTLTLTGKPVQVNVTFVASANYTVTFQESGLPVGTAWSVILGKLLGSSTTSTITFSVPDGTYPFTVTPVIGYYASPTGGNVTVSGGALTALIIFSPVPVGHYNLTFTESGLSSGTPWSVTVSGSTQTSSGTAIILSEPNGTYSFSVGAVTGYTASPATGSVVVNGAATSQTIVFAPVPTYTLTFTEAGLAASVSWSVALNGGTPVASSGTSNTFVEPNGTYSFTVGGAAGYAVTPASGNVTVAGTSVTKALVFTLMTTYAVEFIESGLPAGTSWSVFVAGSSTPYSSTSTSVFVTESNGSYIFTMSAAGYTAYPSPLSLTIAGASLQESITFVKGNARAYEVSFTASGLTSGKSWSVVLNGTIVGSVSPTIDFYETNGSYPFAISKVPGYQSAPPSGIVSVDGGAVTKAIAFTRTQFAGYLATFAETGLSADTPWTVTIGSVSNSSANRTLTFRIPNGSYTFTVGAVSGYEANPASGPLNVHGAPPPWYRTSPSPYRVRVPPGPRSSLD